MIVYRYDRSLQSVILLTSFHPSVLHSSYTYLCSKHSCVHVVIQITNKIQHAVGGWPPRYASAPLLPLWALRRLAPPSPYRRQRSSMFPRSITLPHSQLQLPDGLTRRWVNRPADLDLWSSDLETGVRVTCVVGYPCANFSLPNPLCSQLRPDVRHRQTYVRQHHRLMPPPVRGGA